MCFGFLILKEMPGGFYLYIQLIHFNITVSCYENEEKKALNLIG
jgi:hypothetical protein